MGELVKLSHSVWTIPEVLLSLQCSSAAMPRQRRFLDRINRIDRMDLRRKKKMRISRRDAGAQRKSRGTRDKGIWLSQRTQRLCGKISETSKPASSLYPPEARRPVTCAVTNYFPAFYRCSVRCPQRSQPRYIALPIVQESGVPRFAAYPRLSCSDFFPIFFRTILSPRRQDRKGLNHLAPLRQIGFMLCLACFAREDLLKRKWERNPNKQRLSAEDGGR